jgi:hypothetical protein
MTEIRLTKRMDGNCSKVDRINIKKKPSIEKRKRRTDINISVANNNNNKLLVDMMRLIEPYHTHV